MGQRNAVGDRPQKWLGPKQDDRDYSYKVTPRRLRKSSGRGLKRIGKKKLNKRTVKSMRKSILNPPQRVKETAKRIAPWSAKRAKGPQPSEERGG